MDKTRWISLATLLALAARASALGVTLAASPDSRLRLDGTSTLHPYFSAAQTLEATLAVEADAATAAAAAAAFGAGKPATLDVKVPVVGLKSEHSGLDKNLRSALKCDAKAGKNADIAFKLDAYKAAPGKTGLDIAASGSLTVAGETHPVTLHGSAVVDGDKLVVDGIQPLKMTDFGVKPPTMMMGAIKTADEVTITYHLVLVPAAGKAP